MHSRSVNNESKNMYSSGLICMTWRTGSASKIRITRKSPSCVACKTRAAVIGVVVTCAVGVTLCIKGFFCFISSLANSVVRFDIFTRLRCYIRASLLLFPRFCPTGMFVETTTVWMPIYFKRTGFGVASSFIHFPFISTYACEYNIITWKWEQANDRVHGGEDMGKFH